MHRTFGYLSKRVAHIHPGEGLKVSLTFLYFFLVITAYYVIKPVSRSLVLDDLGHRMVPYADLVCAIAMGPMLWFFARLVDRFAKPQVVTIWFWSVTAIMVLFWRLLALPQPWIAGAFYVWVAIFSVLVVTLFWLVANDLYRPREAKRLFGFIGSGGILGGIVGSSLAAGGAQVLGTERLLLLSAAILLGCWLVVQQLWRLAPERAGDEPPRPRRPVPRETFLSNPEGFFTTLRQSRYLLLLVAFVALNKIVATFVYYQFNPFIEQAFPGVDAKTTFTGLFFGSINVVAFVVQFFFTSWILRRWGVLPAMIVLPAGLLLGGAGVLLVPVFWIAASMELYDRSLSYSLNNTAKEVLYLPIDRSIRYKVKPFIDMVVFRFGKGLAAIVAIGFLNVLGIPARFLSLLIVPLVVAWLVVVVWLRREYTTTIRTILQARAAARRAREAAKAAAELEAELEEPDGAFGALTRARSPTEKLALIRKLFDDRAASTHCRQLLAGLSEYETAPAGASRPGPKLEAEQLKHTIQSREAPLSVRREGVRLLARRADQDTLDYLCGMFLVEQEAGVRDEVVRALVTLRLRVRGAQFPTALIRRQVAREVANYQRVIQIAGVYRRHSRGPVAQDDPILGLLRLLTHESVERIFRFLMLLYRPEDIHLVFEQMQAPDAYLRTDAIELLDNLVDRRMRAHLLPIFDEDWFLSGLEAGAAPAEPTAAYRLLQEAIWDHDCWLSVTTLCAIGCLRLTTMHGELERASRHPQPLISNAARVALQIAGGA